MQYYIIDTNTGEDLDLLETTFDGAVAKACEDYSDIEWEIVPVPDVSDIVRETRFKTGLSQERFAEKYDVPCETLARWESGEAFPPDRLLHRIRIAVEREYE